MSKKTLYLHIGTNKTGTTTIQRFMARNRAKLRARGIFYPEKGPNSGGNHSMFARDLQQLSGGKIARAELWESFLQQVDESTLAMTVVSGEVFWSFGKELPHVQRMIGDLKAHFDDIRVVCYLRRQDLYLRSCYVQAIKSGRSSLGFHEYIEKIAIGKKYRAHEYDKSLDLWASAFGVENIIVRPFERAQLHERGLVVDFCEACNIDWRPFNVASARVANVSPGVRVMAALLYAQTQLPSQKGTDLVARRQTALCSAMAKQLSSSWDDTPFIGFRYGESRAFLDRFRDGNAYVARKYLHRADGRLFYDEAYQELPDGVDDGVTLTPAEIAQVDELVSQVKAELATLKA